MSIHTLLKQYWGYSTFRPLQEDIIQSVLKGHDTLALMPTGGGKSLCFQIPALFSPGICIVVSPLIALMKDQVELLKSKGIAATAIISGMGKREVDILLDNCVFGQIKFLYLSPERLLSELVRERIRHMNVNLFAIDEAHCISQWGYDFRPPYIQLAKLRELHPQVPMLALTATATKKVIADIQDKLAFSNGRIFRKSFERKNLSYIVLNEENKLNKLVHIAHKVAGSGIVYVRSRRRTEEIAQYLNTNNIPATYYHAGIDTSSRTQKQNDWKTGHIRIMVATNAFGMGIDKANVRFVVHLDLPESLEAYYQEAGRAGRDEKKAYAILLCNESDRMQLLKRLELSTPSIQEIKQVYHHLGNYYQLAHGAGKGLSMNFDLPNFCTRFQLDSLKTIHALKFLERDEYISLSESVHLASRIQIITTGEELYRFQVQQSDYDFFIKVLLRTYGGLFDHFVPIKENDLAKRIGLSTLDVIKRLTKLQSLQLLQYLPQTDQPQLLWIKPRTDIQQLFIDRKHILERHRVHQQQIESVIAYSQEPICRNIQLLHYFGDLEAQKCGICDHCLNEKRRNQQEAITHQITNELLKRLSNGQKILEELVLSIATGTEAEKLKVIRLLLDTGWIESDGHTYRLTPSAPVH